MIPKYRNGFAKRPAAFLSRTPVRTACTRSISVPAMHTVVQDFADLLSVMAAAAHDSQITPGEAKTIRARWEELKCVTEEFVHSCEHGDFRDIKKHTEPRK